MADQSRVELARIESELLARLTAAREQYHKAKAEVETLTSLQKGLGLDNAGGARVALRAARLLGYAVRTYCDAVQAFNDFILKNLPSNSSVRR